MCKNTSKVVIESIGETPMGVVKDADRNKFFKSVKSDKPTFDGTGSWLWFIPPLVHYTVCLAPFAIYGIVYYFFGLLPAVACTVGSFYRVYRIILNDSYGDTGAEFGNWTVKGRGHGRKRSVLVVGGGQAGAVTTKELVEEGHDVSCFEIYKDIGGVFKNNFWPLGKLTSSPYITCYSDFEAKKDMPGGTEHWPHFTKDEYVQYLNDYVDHFGIRKCMNMGKRVLQVLQKPNPENDPDCPFVFYAEVQDVDTEEIKMHGPFHNMAVCSGAHSIPDIDRSIPGFDTYKGKILHTSMFNKGETVDEAFSEVSGQGVLTVGLGESMADILGIIADHMTVPPEKIVASIRSGAFVIPRTNPLTGINNDFDTTRIRYSLPKWLLNLSFVVCTYLSNMFPRTRNAEAQVRFKLFRNIPKNGAGMRFATKSAKFVRAAAEGRIDLRVGLKSIDGDVVTFTDGTQVSGINCIIFGSGFKPPQYPYFNENSFKASGQTVGCGCPSRKFLRMFETHLGPSVCFIGFARPLIGSIPTISECQARLFAQVVSGKRQIPDEQTMLRKVKIDRKKQEAELGPYNSKWAPLVFWIPYMDMITQEIGCRPRRSWFWTQPLFALKLVAGGMTAYHYRLVGPNAKPEYARDVINRIPYSGRGADTFFFLGIHLLESIVKWPVFVFYDFVVYPVMMFVGLFTTRKLFSFKHMPMQSSTEMKKNA